MVQLCPGNQPAHNPRMLGRRGGEAAGGLGRGQARPHQLQEYKYDIMNTLHTPHTTLHSAHHTLNTIQTEH